ncbi:MAG: hypothetical protein AAFR53_14265 [Pseudomonadota bacterium]
MYAALIMIAEADKAGFWDAYVAKVQAAVDGGVRFGAEATFQVAGPKAELVVSGITFTIHHDDAAHVVEESADFAAHYGADLPDRGDLAQATTRVTISSTPDPDMVEFNSYVLLVEIAESVGKTWAFDQNGGAFM